MANEHALPPGSSRASRNVPPKRIVVNEGNTVTYLGKDYVGGEEVLIGNGPEADALAFLGHVTIASHDETDAWNGAEGKALFAHAEKNVEAHGQIHPYEHADGPDAYPVDVTPHREQMGQFHSSVGMAAGDDPSHPDSKKKGAK